MLFINALVGVGALFYTVYILCIATDLADGPIARKTNTASNLGALLDSIADVMVIVVALIVFIPILIANGDFHFWMLVLVALVIGIRAIALLIGFAKYRTVTLLHTYANKGSGLCLALFPIWFAMFTVSGGFIFMAVGAVLAALEELLITIRSKKLDRNITWLFGTPKAKAV